MYRVNGVDDGWDRQVGLTGSQVQVGFQVQMELKSRESNRNGSRIIGLIQD